MNNVKDRDDDQRKKEGEVNDFTEDMDDAGFGAGLAVGGRYGRYLNRLILEGADRFFRRGQRV